MPKLGFSDGLVGGTGVYMASPFVTGSELRRRHGDGGCAGQRA